MHQILKRQYNYLMYEGIEHNVQYASGQLTLLRASGKDWSFEEKEAYLKTHFSPKMATFDFARDVGLIILDRASKKIITHYPEEVKLPDYNDIQHTIDPRNKALHRSKDDNLIAAIYMPSLDAYVVSFTLRSFSTDPFVKSLHYMIFTLALPASIAIIGLLFAILRRNVSHPIRTVGETMSEIVSKGSYEKRVEASGIKEIQTLAEQFNTLLSYVNNRNKTLKKYAYSLEELVKERTQKLEQAHGQLVQKERLAAIGEFTAAVVHELRNPLTSIKLGVARLKNADALTPNDQERLSLAQEQTEKLEYMLSEILDFAAMRPTSRESVCINDIISKLTILAHDICEQRSVSFEELILDKKYIVKIDKNKLEQVWLNIAKNACDAAYENTQISLKLKEGGKIYLSIINIGDEISESALDRLFEPFFTTKSSGTGLGLAICKKLMTEMGGDIDITSENGKTTATLIMELEKVE
jgi:signal transduction histidine kinase